MTILHSPITSSADSVANFHVFVFFSSNGMQCGIPLKEDKGLAELPPLLEKPLSATMLKDVLSKKVGDRLYLLDR